MRIFVLLSSIAFLFFACATNPHKVTEIDSDIDKKGQIGASEIGVNKDGELIIQNSSSVDDEMRQTEWANNKLEDDLKHEHYFLKMCRNDLSDPRLGGNSQVQQIPAVDNLRSPSQMREKFGLNKEGKLKFVKREYYLDRLKQERELIKSLKKTLKTVRQHRESCERRMAAARVKQGLPAKRYKAQGYFTGNGSWVETRKAENSLDDAFQIKAKSTQK